jgi:hypothetical protein
MENAWLGDANNSIGIWNNGDMHIDGEKIEFKNSRGFFKEGDFLGIGIIHGPISKMECFVTSNGELLGKNY